MMEIGLAARGSELIEGDPGKLDHYADKLAHWATALENIGDGMGAVRVPGWTGKASDAFWDEFSGQKTRWLHASDSLSSTATTLRDYAGVLRWAQSQASEAIELSRAGDEQGAYEMLSSARSHLAHEGDTAAKKFKEQGGGADNAPDWLYWAEQDAESETGKTSRTVREHERRTSDNDTPEQRERKRRRWGDPEGAKDEKHHVEVKIASASGEAKVWGAEAKGRDHALGGDVSGKAGVSTLGVEGSASAGAAGGNLTASAEGKAYLGKASAEGKYEAGLFETSGKVDAVAGADANAKASIGKDGAHLGGEAFAGAKATAEGHASVAGIGVGGTAEGWAGAGATANADIGQKDGKWVIGAEVGVGLGLGGKVGGSVEIDPSQVSDAVGDAADAVGDWFD